VGGSSPAWAAARIRVEGTADLKRAAVLQELQLQRHGTGQAESIRFDFGHRSTPYPPGDPDGCGPHVGTSDHLGVRFPTMGMEEST
jgi:hypothetical protein